MNDDDHDLLRAYRGGDPSAAERLAERALRIATRTAAAMVGDRHRAADIAQDVAVDVLRGVERLRDPASLDAWIHRIAVRRTMRDIRATRRRAGAETSLDETAEAIPEAGDLPADVAERRELATTVRVALAGLPEKQRMALVLRYVHDLSYEQIAEAMGTSSGNAGSLISRGRDALRSREDITRLFGREP